VTPEADLGEAVPKEMCIVDLEVASGRGRVMEFVREVKSEGEYIPENDGDESPG
jgi:hypothetical protein